MSTQEIHYRLIKHIDYNQVRLELLDLNLCDGIEQTSNANMAFTNFPGDWVL